MLIHISERKFTINITLSGCVKIMQECLLIILFNAITETIHLSQNI